MVPSHTQRAALSCGQKAVLEPGGPACRLPYRKGEDTVPSPQAHLPQEPQASQKKAAGRSLSSHAAEDELGDRELRMEGLQDSPDSRAGGC